MAKSRANGKRAQWLFVGFLGAVSFVISDSSLAWYEICCLLQQSFDRWIDCSVDWSIDWWSTAWLDLFSSDSGGWWSENIHILKSLSWAHTTLLNSSSAFRSFTKSPVVGRARRTAPGRSNRGPVAGNSRPRDVWARTPRERTPIDRLTPSTRTFACTIKPWFLLNKWRKQIRNNYDFCGLSRDELFKKIRFIFLCDQKNSRKWLFRDIWFPIFSLLHYSLLPYSDYNLIFFYTPVWLVTVRAFILSLVYGPFIGPDSDLFWLLSILFEYQPGLWTNFPWIFDEEMIQPPHAVWSLTASFLLYW